MPGDFENRISTNEKDIAVLKTNLRTMDDHLIENNKRTKYVERLLIGFLVSVVFGLFGVFIQQERNTTSLEESIEEVKNIKQKVILYSSEDLLSELIKDFDPLIWEENRP